ncbi:MAG: putative manganese-dependent inorganic diphosphatase [Planctomycetota bacterium]
MPLYVFGHKNPDTDAICSALAYAELLRQTSHPDAVAACCGTPNLRTEFALHQAGVAPPRIIMDIRPELEDVCQRDVVKAHCDDVFFEVYQRMEEREIRSIPVVDDDGGLVGIVTLLDLLELMLTGGVDPIRSREVSSSLDQIAGVVEGHFQHRVETDRLNDFIVMVGAMSAGGFTKRMEKFPADRLLVISGDRPTIQLPALESGVRCLVVTGGYELSQGLLQLAKANNVSVLISPHDTATTTTRIKASQRIARIIQKDILTLNARTPVAVARPQVFRSAQTIFPVIDDGKLMGVISKSDLVNPPQPKIVLVDHNELSQAVEGAEDADIIEVLDHHRLGGSLKSNHPITFRMEPLGSTCTLVARMYRAAGIQPTPGMALCMASGIISDTLELRSPTTTDIDRDTMQWLQGFCDVDLHAYANEFFAVGSALRSCTPEEVVREDCKRFEEKGRHFSISQIEEIGFDLFWQRQDELAAALAEMARTDKLEFSALLVTDISSNGSLLLMSSEPDGWEDINYPQLEDKLYRLDSVVSRKKQLLPLITRLLDAAPSALPQG